MDLRTAFAAVCAEPREDGPRERFADLVAAAEPATASFIRDQLDLARRRRQHARRNREVERGAMRVAAPPPGHDARFARARELLEGTVPAWTQRFGFGRGFLEKATVDGAWFATRGTDLLAAAPVIDVAVHALPPDATACFDNPAWAQVRALHFVGPPITLAQVEALAASPYLVRLVWLDIAAARLPEAAIHAIAASPTLRALRYVRADGNGFPDPNPTLDEADGQVYGELRSAFGEALRARHGERPWLVPGVPAEAGPPPEALG
jgi:hypothetical protein